MGTSGGVSKYIQSEKASKCFGGTASTVRVVS